jgi:hypothetical protein
MLKPQISDEARKVLVDEYVGLRGADQSTHGKSSYR